MKISILTATYNRANLLKKLYKSIVENNSKEIVIEWLIMNDGSSDDTEEIVKKFINENVIKILYFKQKNMGKMNAINNLIQHVTGDLIIECDSDDYFINGSFDLIYEQYKNNKNQNIYALCFLKYDKNGKNIGAVFKNDITTMFDLYFREGENGEKALVYYGKIRKKFKYELEENERFVTEARMHHKIDLKYKIKCVNKPIMICEYQDNGYTKNIIDQFIQNPKGYYNFFKEILERDTKNISFKKRIYIIKHYILFKYLTNSKKGLRSVKGYLNRIIYILLYIPGVILSQIKYRR